MARASFVAGGMPWWVRDGADVAEARRRVAAALARLGATAGELPPGRKQRYRLALERPGAADHLLKRRASSPWRPRLRSRARRELAVAGGLAARGVPVVGPLAVGVRRRRGIVAEEWVLVPLLDGVDDLAARAAAADLGASEQRRLAAALGRLARAAHDAGLVLADFTPTNVLVERRDPGALRLVDFERARLGRRPGPRARARMLARLERGLGDASAALRLRFLRAYAPGRERDWWRRLAVAARRLARRDARRLARAAAHPGRRFRRLEVGGWRGVGRADVPRARLLRAAALPPRPDAAQERSWDLRLAGRSPRAARATFARATALSERGLAPRPLALLRRGAGWRLVLEGRPPAPRPARAAGAVARLEARLAALGRLGAPLAPGDFALEPGAGGRLRALLAEPERFRFRRAASRAPGRRDSGFSPGPSLPITTRSMSDCDPSRPILSSRADDPELAPVIERFVIDLAERIDRLQDAESLLELELLGSLARRLVSDSQQLGFSYLTTCAGVIESACLVEDAEAAHKGVVEITDVARRIRLGHRGAA